MRILIILANPTLSCAQRAGARRKAAARVMNWW